MGVSPNGLLGAVQNFQLGVNSQNEFPISGWPGHYLVIWNGAGHAGAVPNLFVLFNRAVPDNVFASVSGELRGKRVACGFRWDDALLFPNIIALGYTWKEIEQESHKKRGELARLGFAILPLKVTKKVVEQLKEKLQEILV